jgi:hypothetical protein
MFRYQELDMSRFFTIGVLKRRNVKLRNVVSTKVVVTAIGHIVKELIFCFGVSSTANWKFKKPNNKIVEISKWKKSLGSARGHIRWSHQQKMGGVIEDKLLFRVSGVGKWRELKSSTMMI